MEAEALEHMDTTTTSDVSNASFPAELVVAAIAGAASSVIEVPNDVAAGEQVQQQEEPPVEQPKDMAPVGSSTAPLSPFLPHPPVAAVRMINIPYILNGELYEIQTQEGENVTVKCCHCPPDRVYRGSVRSTGNFHMHIKRRHPDLLGKLHDMKVNALLERRDRLMRNRKVPMTTSQRRGGVGGGGSSKLNAAIIKQELLLHAQQLPNVSPPPPHLSLMHTHKLKIRTAFQRHQLQQQQQQQQQLHQQQQQQVESNWDPVAPFVVVAPNTSASEVHHHLPEPLNYCFKSSVVVGREQQQCAENLNFNTVNRSSDLQNEENSGCSGDGIQTLGTLVSMSPKFAEPIGGFESLPNLEERRQTETSCAFSNSGKSQQQMLYNDESDAAAAAVTRYQTSSSSSSCVSNISVGGSNNNKLHNYHTSMPTTVKNEPMLLMMTSSPPHQAIDLSMQSSVSSSGIGSAADISFGSGNHINNHNNNMSGGDGTAIHLQWQDLLVQVEHSMRELQRELCARNQIETNRMYLDLAKFKYLHPGFNYQC